MLNKVFLNYYISAEQLKCETKYNILQDYILL